MIIEESEEEVTIDGDDLPFQPDFAGSSAHHSKVKHVSPKHDTLKDIIKKGGSGFPSNSVSYRKDKFDEYESEEDDEEKNTVQKAQKLNRDQMNSNRSVTTTSEEVIIIEEDEEEEDTDRAH